MAYKLKILNSANLDTHEIIAYIAVELVAPDAALNFKQQLRACYDRLKEHPLMFQLYNMPELAQKGYRRAPMFCTR